MCVSHCKCQLYLHMKINITYINIYIYDLHGPRHIQKTGPKLIAIEPKLIAIPYNTITVYESQSQETQCKGWAWAIVKTSSSPNTDC